MSIFFFNFFNPFFLLPASCHLYPRHLYPCHLPSPPPCIIVATTSYISLMLVFPLPHAALFSFVHDHRHHPPCDVSSHTSSSSFHCLPPLHTATPFLSLFACYCIGSHHSSPPGIFPFSSSMHRSSSLGPLLTSPPPQAICLPPPLSINSIGGGKG